MSVTARAASVDALWELHDVLHAEGPGVGLPLVLLERLRTALGCEALAFNAMDSRRERHRFMQVATADESDEVLNPENDEIDAVFWQRYWGADCSWPDQTTDLTQVLRQSDVTTRRDWLANPMSELFGDGQEHEVMVAWPDGGPGQTLRLLAWRGQGRDFDENDVLLLELLQPHLHAAYLKAEAGRQRLAGSGVGRLTERQHAVLGLVREGHTNYSIGRALGISEGTVRTHLQNIYCLLGVSSRTAAVMELEQSLPR
ncbi:LuxR C-terminal-related transcriptional regulator [Ornithinimicrobium sp. F0845]|uniref:helix-turn-helix transcriptional regulator n=1 Tax=Ornithinimicrobium sp. F0845 TaxID=2926412 RepID=UPI001FF688A8|nr:helix-turn-helix transcriptional regulator [Ornithinimicrobium sp. F0845]MCK0113257.1 LuxR C-terminal-related transcriptional regulator [Ornithinimicrobium sp. F0845]